MRSNREPLWRVAPALGDAITGRFHLLGLLAEGSSTLVFEAQDARTARPLAIKALTPAASASAEAALRREGEILSRLQHPNVLQLRQDFSHERPPFLVLERASAGSLQDALDREGPLRRRSGLLIALQLLDALEVCHAAGVVHRDIKPQNLLLHGERLLLADFSVASAPGLPPPPKVHSGAFAAPELLADGHTHAPASDLYSACATLYHVVTGWTPFRLHEAAEDSPRWAGLDEPMRELLYWGTRAPLRARVPGLSTLKALVLHMLTEPEPDPGPMVSLPPEEEITEVV